MAASNKPPKRNSWGSTASGSPDIAEAPYVDSGWPAPSTDPVKPPRGYFNFEQNRYDDGMNYLLQRGVADWSADETDYDVGAIVRYTDNRYWQLVGTATPGTPPSSDLTNWQLWLASPIAAASQWADAIWTWMNAKRHRGFGLDHQGMPAGRFMQWQEDWIDGAAAQLGGTGTAAANWFGRWKYGIVEVAGLHGKLYANGPWLSDLTTHPWGPIVGVLAGRDAVGPPGPGAVSSAVIETVHPVILMPNAFVSLEAAFSINSGLSAPTADKSFAWGFSDGSLASGGSTDPMNVGGAIPIGAYFYRDSAGTANWLAQTHAPGGGGAGTNTGIAATVDTARRGRIEIVGSTSADDSANAVRFYIDGALVATHSVSMLNAPLTPFVRATANNSASSLINLGPMRFTAKLDLGDHPII